LLERVARIVTTYYWLEIINYVAEKQIIALEDDDVTLDSSPRIGV